MHGAAARRLPLVSPEKLHHAIGLGSFSVPGATAIGIGQGRCPAKEDDVAFTKRCARSSGTKKDTA
jgi:hypothetical protein